MGDFFPKNILDFEDFEAHNSPGIFDGKIKGENLGSKNLRGKYPELILYVTTVSIEIEQRCGEIEKKIGHTSQLSFCDLLLCSPPPSLVNLYNATDLNRSIKVELFYGREAQLANKVSRGDFNVYTANKTQRSNDCKSFKH